MAELVRFPYMRKLILKWRRDRAVARMSRNGKNLRQARVDLSLYYEHVPFEERDIDYVESLLAEVARLRLAIEDDKDFIRKTA